MKTIHNVIALLRVVSLTVGFVGCGSKMIKTDEGATSSSKTSSTADNNKEDKTGSSNDSSSEGTSSSVTKRPVSNNQSKEDNTQSGGNGGTYNPPKTDTSENGDDEDVVKGIDYAGADGINAYISGTDRMTVGFYVSNKGDDSDSGTIEKPFKTIKRAQSAVRDYKSKNTIPPGGIAVWLREGTYQLSDTLKFTAEDSGPSEDCPVVYTAHQDEEVHISANKIVDSSFIKKTTSSWKNWNLVPETVRDRIYQVNLLDATDIDGNKIFTSNWDSGKNSLFVDNTPTFWMYQNNVPMTLSRYPDINDNDRYSTASWDTISKASGNSFKPSNATVSSWNSSEEIYIHSPFSWMNDDFITRVSSINSSGFITLSSNPGGHGIADPDYGANEDSVRPYYAMNIVSELTQSGEYYFDGTTSTVYYIAYDNNGSYDLSVTPYSYDYAMNLNNTNNFVIKNLFIEGGDKAIININDCDNVTLRNCTVRNCVSNGIIADGTDISVDYCDIYNLGRAGVTLNGGDRINLSKSGNTVSNNHIHDYAIFKMNGNAGVTMASHTSCGHKITNNTIHHAPQQAIYIGGNEIQIEYNEIYDICRLTDDAGAIYGARDWSFRGIDIKYNIIHDITPTVAGRPGAGSYAIYLDDCLSGIDVIGNIMYNGTSAAIMSNGGRDNKMENNVMINFWRGFRTSFAGTSLNNSGNGMGVNNIPGNSWNLLEKLNSVNYQSAVWSVAYPTCVAIPNDYDILRPIKTGTIRVASEWLKPENCSFKANIGYGDFKKGWIVSDSGVATDVYFKGINTLNNFKIDTSIVNISGNNVKIDFNNQQLKEIGFNEIPIRDIGIMAK